MLQFPLFGGALDVGRARPCAPHDAIPPFAGGEAAGRGGEAAGLHLRRPASWPQRRLASCVARTFTPEM